MVLQGGDVGCCVIEVSDSDKLAILEFVDSADVALEETSCGPRPAKGMIQYDQCVVLGYGLERFELVVLHLLVQDAKPFLDASAAPKSSSPGQYLGGS